MSDYKHTLNLPETPFPMRGNLAQREPKMLKAWYEDDLYGQIRSAKKGKKTFIFFCSVRMDFAFAIMPA